MPAFRRLLVVLALPVAAVPLLAGCDGARVRFLDFERPEFEVSTSPAPGPIAFETDDEASTASTPPADEAAAKPDTPPPPQTASSALVREAIAACEANSLRRSEIDWTALRARAESLLREGKSADEVIRSVVAELRDGHSSYQSAAEAASLEGTKVMTDARSAGSAPGSAGASPSAPASPRPSMPPYIEPTGKLVAGKDGTKLGYLRIPYLITMDEALMNGYVAKASALQRELVDAGAKAWIIDLRRNVGGNQWPMLASLSAILGDGPHGAIVSPTGERVAWGTSKGASWMNSPESVVFAVESFRAPDTSRLPVAILIDQRTASSGESIAVSFRGRLNTRFFGDQTAGKSSANVTVKLGDGSLLNITTSALYDRSGTAYGGPIAPDVAFNLPAPTRDAPFPGAGGSADGVLDAAVEWLGRAIENKPDGPGTRRDAPQDLKK